MIFANRFVLSRVGMGCGNDSEPAVASAGIPEVDSKDVDYKGHTHHASKDEPQYEIESDTTDHIAMHKGSALKKLST